MVVENGEIAMETPFSIHCIEKLVLQEESTALIIANA